MASEKHDPGQTQKQTEFQSFEQSIEMLRQAHREALADQLRRPKVALLKAREMAEAICKQIVCWEFSAYPVEKTLHKLIERLKSEKILPPYIVPAFKTVQSYGNIGAHFLPKAEAALITSEYAQPCMDSLSQALEWFISLYRPPQTVRPREPISKQRRIDAAVPGHAELRQHVQLLVQARFPDAAEFNGNGALWGRQNAGTVIPLSEEVSIRFPVDQKTGEVLPARLRIAVIAPDFLLHGTAEKMIEVPPDQESSVLSFLLTAREKGRCRIQVDVYDDRDVCLGSLPVETDVDGERVDGMNVAQFVFLVGVSDSLQTAGADAGIQQLIAALPQLASFHHALENEQALNALSRQALQAIAPEQAALNAGVVSSLLKMAVDGEKITVQKSTDVPGGFGGGAMMAQVVVPVMVELLSRLLNLVGEITLEDVKTDPQKLTAFRDALQRITTRDVQPIINQIGASLGRKQLRQFTEQMKQVVGNYLAGG